MKVLHVYRTYFPDTQGGLEESIRQIALATTARGVDNRILSLSGDPSPSMLARPEARVFRGKRHLSLSSCDIGFGLVEQFRALARDADLLHFHFPWPFADLVNLLGNPGRPHIVTYHSDVVRQRLLGWCYRPLMRHLLSRAAAIVPTSPEYLASSPVLARYEDRCRVIPLGVDEASYPAVDEDTLQAMREQYGEGFFLFVGVFRYYKGLHLLLSALRGAGYRVVLAGDGPLRSRLEAQARELELHNVAFAGHVSDEEKMALLRLSRAVVLPSHLRSEAFGVTLLEAAMSGKAMISTALGTGTSHVNADGETGLVVAPGSVSELRWAMDTLHADPDRAEHMGHAARARFELHFTGEVVGRAYQTLYEDVLASSGDRR